MAQSLMSNISGKLFSEASDDPLTRYLFRKASVSGYAIVHHMTPNKFGEDVSVIWK